MLAAIGDAKTCPHGHPIVEGDARAGRAARRLRGRRQGSRAALRERGRGAASLPEDAGLDPGWRASVESSDDDEVVVASDDGRHAVSRSVAETVSVRADPSPPPRAPLPEQLELSSDRLRSLIADAVDLAPPCGTGPASGGPHVMRSRSPSAAAQCSRIAGPAGDPLAGSLRSRSSRRARLDCFRPPVSSGSSLHLGVEAAIHVSTSTVARRLACLPDRDPRSDLSMLRAPYFESPVNNT